MTTRALLVASLFFVGCGTTELSISEDTDPGPGEVNPSVTEQGLGSMPPCHTALASWDGTTAYSNGPSTGTGVSCGGVVATGYRYQCVELVMRHFSRKWGLRWYGNARDLLNNAPRSTVDVYWNGDAAHPPVPGDMLVWRQGTYGHVALITAVRADAVDIIEQNVSGNGRATLGYRNGTIAARWGSWTPAGWAHAKANTTTPVEPPQPPQPPAVNWSCASSAFNGAQFWTCSSGSRYRCENGTPVKDTCSAGCMSRSSGTDDLCISATTSWSCSSSAYQGAQYWTCSAGSLYRCESGQPRVVRCPSGCNVRAVGTNDDCR